MAEVTLIFNKPLSGFALQQMKQAIAANRAAGWDVEPIPCETCARNEGGDNCPECGATPAAKRGY